MINLKTKRRWADSLPPFLIFRRYMGSRKYGKMNERIPSVFGYMVCPRPLIWLQIEFWHVTLREVNVGPNLPLRELSETPLWLIVNTKEGTKQSVALAMSISVARNWFSPVEVIPKDLFLMQTLDQSSILNGRLRLLAVEPEGTGFDGTCRRNQDCKA